MIASHTDMSIRGNDHRRARTPLVALGVALAITAGAYATSHGSGGAAPEARPTPAGSDSVMPSERAMSEMDRTIRALHGPQPQRLSTER